MHESAHICALACTNGSKVEVYVLIIFAAAAAAAVQSYKLISLICNAFALTPLPARTDSRAQKDPPLALFWGRLLAREGRGQLLQI